MKTLALILSLTALLTTACKKSERVINTSLIDPATPIKSINAYKNGKPIINYLGIKMDGC